MASLTPEQGIHQKRRVIFNTLIHTFGDASRARHYFGIWLTQHALDTSFVAMRFASTVALGEIFSEEQKAHFLRLLYENLAKPYEALPRYPADWVIATKKASASRSQASMDQSSAEQTVPMNRQPLRQPVTLPPIEETPARIVFKGFAKIMTDAILVKLGAKHHLLDDVMNDIRASLAEKDLILLAMMTRWGAAKFEMTFFPKAYSKRELRYLAHLLYLIAADLLGPPQADKLLDKAVSTANRLPEANDFHPQNLL